MRCRRHHFSCFGRCTVRYLQLIIPYYTVASFQHSYCQTCLNSKVLALAAKQAYLCGVKSALNHLSIIHQFFSKFFPIPHPHANECWRRWLLLLSNSFPLLRYASHVIMWNDVTHFSTRCNYTAEFLWICEYCYKTICLSHLKVSYQNYKQIKSRPATKFHVWDIVISYRL